MERDVQFKGGQGHAVAPRTQHYVRSCPDLQAWRTALKPRCAAPQTPEKRAEGDEERSARLEAESATRADAARRRAELLRQRLQEQQRREQVGSCCGENRSRLRRGVVSPLLDQREGL